MAVISSFDQWKKDIFFSAAEEVQESADTMESVYRMWIRERNDHVLQSEISDELRRELHTCLGTAKWQLEEFEKAVSLSHQNYPSEDNRITRHREFIVAIRNQICCIEKSMNDSLIAEGKEPLRWFQLDEDERDEFETFLSSSSSAPKTLPETKDKYVNLESVRRFKETVTIKNDAKYVVEVAAKDGSKNQDEMIVQEENSSEQRRTWSSPDNGAWKIVIADEEDADKKLVEARRETHNLSSSLCRFLRSVETRVKFKWFGNSFQKPKSGEHIQSRQGFSNYLGLKGINPFSQGINRFSDRGWSCSSSCKDDSKVTNAQQIVGRFGGLQRNMQGSQSTIQFGCSLRVTLFLLLTVFLIVPFVLHWT